MTVELRSILRDLDEMQRRMDRLLDRGIAEMQLTASRQSLAESHDLARLTWLATIFIPLTFMSGLFSMNENIGSLKDSLRTYFSVAIPLAVVALLIARFGAVAIKSVILTWIVLLSVIPYSLSFKDLYRYWRQRRRGRI
jgi:Mg2+ and Co2+ transporter CorA